MIWHMASAWTIQEAYLCLRHGIVPQGPFGATNFRMSTFHLWVLTYCLLIIVCVQEKSSHLHYRLIYKGSIRFDLDQSSAPIYTVFTHGVETVP